MKPAQLEAGLTEHEERISEMLAAFFAVEAAQQRLLREIAPLLLLNFSANYAQYCTAVTDPRGGPRQDAQVKGLTELIQAAETARREAIRESRTSGRHTWKEIAAALGTTAQGAQQRFGQRPPGRKIRSDTGNP